MTVFGKKSEPAPIRESRHTGPTTVADCRRDYEQAATVREDAEKQWRAQREGR